MKDPAERPNAIETLMDPFVNVSYNLLLLLLLFFSFVLGVFRFFKI